MIRLFNQDCMTAMASMPNRAYELAIVDPPYGIGKRLTSGGATKGWCGMVGSGAEKWDILPTPEYFKELFRVSINQIVWGGNFHALPPTQKPLCWDKVRPNQKNASEWEYAWTSFIGRAEKFSYCANAGFILTEPRIHPTQKPVRLYEWLLKNYAKPGDKILDTHGGSGSICIACDIMGFDLDWYEIDKDYYDAAKERFERHKQQEVLAL
jgi:site-specific DNA-methyltransferase (adenine-specific)